MNPQRLRPLSPLALLWARFTRHLRRRRQAAREAALRRAEYAQYRLDAEREAIAVERAEFYASQALDRR